ncbi:hypothetical protein [Streptomyces sp. AK02-01A]|uniref:hypothetical protein n=1 Tax=Streptomyces sp. AK02-01A TaxID=3028648 RepID=UPI0029AD9BDE|nr:hypothetical protein [Streptomyces sp. AK02-01A]MDX3855622.1 hypothetical protein [Streptomyces sp. AK02-01A]
MRDSIAQILVWPLLLRLPSRKRRPGAVREAARHVPAAVRHRPGPWRGPSSAEARAFFRDEAAARLTPQQRERFWATAFAEIGVDYPYRYRDDQFAAQEATA